MRRCKALAAAYDRRGYDVPRFNEPPRPDPAKAFARDVLEALGRTDRRAWQA